MDLLNFGGLVIILEISSCNDFDLSHGFLKYWPQKAKPSVLEKTEHQFVDNNVITLSYTAVECLVHFLRSKW